MKIYKYDIQTKEFLEELEINEQYGINLPFTTATEPLTKKDGFAICFNGTKWEYIEDNRDKTVYVKDTKSGEYSGSDRRKAVCQILNPTGGKEKGDYRKGPDK